MSEKEFLQLWNELEFSYNVIETTENGNKTYQVFYYFYYGYFTFDKNGDLIELVC